jgi:hypothetical protein
MRGTSKESPSMSGIKKSKKVPPKGDKKDKDKRSWVIGYR